ncbi:hypothetical protein BaRGS_00012911 [Batillaria attramentaria]|uniref:Uncharacterized protein n=1 Tax=Batillaria attramentaria TaxID=370345 RepID=A0ABD0L9F8_9CAEN
MNLRSDLLGFLKVLYMGALTFETLRDANDLRIAFIESWRAVLAFDGSVSFSPRPIGIEFRPLKNTKQDDMFATCRESSDWWQNRCRGTHRNTVAYFILNMKALK